MTRKNSPRSLVLRGASYPGDIRIVDGIITEIVKTGQLLVSPDDEVVEAQGCLITAGLVNTHHHLFQRMLRGRAVGCDLLGWLRELLPVWSRLNAEDMVMAARLGAAELALGGVTTTADHHFVVPNGDDTIFDALVEAVGAIGLRLVLCRGAIDLTELRGGFVPENLAEDPQDFAVSVERLVRRYRDNTLVDIAVAPSSLFAVTSDLLEAAVDVARGTNTRLHLHMSESATEVGYVRERFGRRPVELLDDLGWLDHGMWMAHGIHLNEFDRQRLGEARVGVAHCPASNARLGAGIADSVGLESAGCLVGLGIDGASANDAGGMLTQMRLAWWLARARGGAASCAAGDVWKWATKSGAAAMGRPDLGHLAVGAVADVAIWDIDDLGDFKIPDEIGDLLIMGPDRSVRHLVVAGRLVVVDGEVKGLDLDQMRVEVTQRARSFSAR